MRKTGKTLVLVAMAAVAAGMTSPALAGHGPARARFPVSGRLHARVGTVGCRLEP